MLHNNKTNLLCVENIIIYPYILYYNGHAIC